MTTKLARSALVTACVDAAKALDDLADSIRQLRAENDALKTELETKVCGTCKGVALIWSRDLDCHVPCLTCQPKGGEGK